MGLQEAWAIGVVRELMRAQISVMVIFLSSVVPLVGFFVSKPVLGIVIRAKWIQIVRGIVRCYFTMPVWARMHVTKLALEKTYSGWWFRSFFIFHNIWDNPSH
jgi:hypothetical protein